MHNIIKIVDNQVEVYEIELIFEKLPNKTLRAIPRIIGYSEPLCEDGLKNVSFAALSNLFEEIDGLLKLRSDKDDYPTLEMKNYESFNSLFNKRITIRYFVMDDGCYYDESKIVKIS